MPGGQPSMTTTYPFSMRFSEYAYSKVSSECIHKYIIVTRDALRGEGD